MFTIAMAEDSYDDALRVRLLLDRFIKTSATDVRLRRYDNGRELIERYSDDIDLVLLDIDMPIMNGLATARAIRDKNPSVSICFMTNYGQLAPEGYAVDAMGFLIKPLSYRPFQQIIQRAIDRGARRRTLLVPIKQGKLSTFVDANEITYAETERKRTIIHTVRGPVACSESMKAVEDKLKERAFFRIHNAFLVSLAHIQTITSTDVVIDNQELPISKHRRQAFLAALTEYVGKTI